ncbi:MAG: PLP-dependent aminotransferase family protein [Inquilinus sp.]|nr:PLP-dependent aminotransferase family protein [Inquilinus sp.]
MRDALFHLERTEATTLQSQIRQTLVSAVLDGQLAPGSPVPSTRAMARRLKVSRNTVTLAYQALVTDGFLAARERSGFYVAEDAHTVHFEAAGAEVADDRRPVDWARRFRVQPTRQDNIQKPVDWRDYPYPFIYGQMDAELFPIAEWRDCVRQAMGTRWLDAWTEDRFTQDDPMLIEQIRRRILPRRGISANADEILVTLGAQNALYLLASLFVMPTTTVAVEDPGYPDVRNIFRLRTDQLRTIPVDDAGIAVDDRLVGTELVFTTPSHQFPTTVTMSLDRRKALLAAAHRNRAVIIEDDYESETNFCGEPYPALKSLDRDGRVMYVGSLSKSLMPGLRLGFVVASPTVIREARALRRLMLRHPPGNNQRTAALFLAGGHYDTLIHRLHRAYRGRWRTMGQALNCHFPGWSRMPSFGGTSYWVQGPPSLDADALAVAARDKGVLIEPGAINFAGEVPPKNHFRLGFSSIPEDRIEPGIALLAELIGKAR